MAGFKIDLFKGMRPRISTLKLPPGEAQVAENVELGSGDLSPWLDKSTEQAVSAGRLTRTIHRFDNNGDPIWLEWDDYVDVVRGPVKGDLLERTYYTGDTTGNSAPKMTNTNLVGLSPPYPQDWTYLGIPAPATALNATAPPLPEDLPADQRYITSPNTKSDELVVDRVEFTVYPGTGTPTDVWRMAATATGGIQLNVQPGTSFRVTEVINFNKVKLESASDPGIFARTINSDKTTVNDWKPMEEQGSTQAADFIGWAAPVGVEVTIISHRLNVGDVITVSSLQTPFIFYAALTTDFYEQSWAAPTVVSQGGVSHYEVQNARVSASAVSGGTPWTIVGACYYDVDRVASTVSELQPRTYVYTYVSDLGEEGPPSPPSATINALDGTSIALNGLDIPPSIGYNITKMRIYRTNSTEAGTEYQFVKEINVSQTGGYDTIPAAELGEVINTTTWDPPDPNMIGLTEMPNGMMVGFFGKNLYFCEPYFPHAWPPEYDQAVGYDIVGLASFGNSVAVLTTGWPYIITGAHPRNVNVRPVKVKQACLSKESIATNNDNVYYASPDGLMELSVNGLRLATDRHLDKKQWELYGPSTMVSEFHDGRYYGFHDFDASFIELLASAEVSGTVTSALEEDIVAGGKTIILTLTNDIWVDAGVTFDNQRQAIIDGLTSTSVQTLGWNNLVRDIALTPPNVVRTSDTVVTITLPAVTGYATTSSETILPTIPAAAILVSNIDVTTQTFTVTAQFPIAQVSIGGTLAGTGESNVRTGGFTVTLTIVDDTWVAAGTEFDSVRQIIIDGVTATTDEPNGWNDTVPNQIAVTDVVRTSDTLVTITLPAVAAYEITVNENIIALIPSSALQISLVDATALNSIAILGSVANPLALFSGSVTTALESDIVTGSKELIITLTNDTWIAAGTGPIGTTAQSQSIIDALIATTSQTLGWNNVVRPGIEVADLVRTSATVATITLDPEATYSISASETIGATIPGAVLTAAGSVVVSNTFGITAQAPATCTVSGTITASVEEDAIIAGGKTIVLTLSSDTWAAQGTGPVGSTLDTQALIDGITSAQVEATGWNTVVRDVIDNTIGGGQVVRTSDTVVTITLPAAATYAITATETITVTVPAVVLNTSASAVVASPTFTVAEDIPAAAAISGTATISLTADEVRAGGKKIVITISNDQWVAAGATFNAQRQAIINGITSASAGTNGWNNEVRDGTLVPTNVVRTNNTTVTVTLPFSPLYAAVADETLTVTVPASAMVQSLITAVGTPTITLSTDFVTFVMGAVPAWPSIHGPYAAYTDSSFTDWTETEVRATDAIARWDAAAVAYSATDDAWVMAVPGTDPTKTDIWRSTDDGANWTKVFTGTAAGLVYRIYWHPEENIFIAAFRNAPYSTLALGAYYSENGGVTWVTRGTGASDFWVLAADPIIWGGAAYVYTRPINADGAGGVYTYAMHRSVALSGVTPVESTWSRFNMAFDGISTARLRLSAGSGNGKIMVIGVTGTSASTLYGFPIPGSTNWSFHVSSFLHGTLNASEDYGGALNETNSISPTSKAKLVYTGTYWIFWGGEGEFMTLVGGSEGSVGAWSAPIDKSSVFTGYVLEDFIWDPGSAGKSGLGLVLVGYNLSTGAGAIFTAPDESLDFVLSKELSLDRSRILSLASKYVEDLS